MILVGFNCPSCGADVLDSIDHCYKCNAPYTGTLAEAARAHHMAKLTLVEAARRDTSIERTTRDVRHLMAASETIALMAQAGVPQTDASMRSLLLSHEQ